MYKYLSRLYLTLFSLSLAMVSVSQSQFILKNSAQSEILRITTTGNVGVMTTNPSARLAVNGGMSIGADYAQVAAPTNGMIVQSVVGIGAGNSTAYAFCVPVGIVRINQLNINGAYTFPTAVGTTNQYLNGVGQWAAAPSDGDGVIGNEITAATNGTLTRSASQPYTLALNLGNANTWTAAQTFAAGAVFPGPGIWNSSGNVGVGITTPGSKLSVNGGATIGADYAAIAAPTNGLLVKGLVGINTTTPDRAQLNVYWNATNVSDRFNILGEAFTTNNNSVSIGVHGCVDYPSAISASVRSGVRGDLLGDVFNTKYTIAQGDLGFYVGPSNTIAGVYGHIYGQTAQWGSVATGARRAAVAAMNVNGTQEDFGLYAYGPRHYLEGELFVRGEAYHVGGNGYWKIPSDGALKDVGGAFTRGLQEILALNPVRYFYKKDNSMQLPSDQELYGYVAQEVEKVIPEAVRHDKSGYLSMYSDPILLALVNAVKELNAQNDDLQAQIKKLQKP
jgi:trimeric autotransporter adhesin